MEAWVSDYQGEINDILGSSKNDGLVAEESQFYPRINYRYDLGKEINVHNNVVGISSTENYIGLPEYNHKTIGPYLGDAAKRLENLGISVPNEKDYVKYDPVFKAIILMQKEADQITQ